MDTIRLYLHSMGMLIKSQLQYPVSFVLQTLAQLVMEGGEMMAVILLVDRFERLNQWGPGDLYFFFGLMSVTFYLTECFGRGITGNFPYLIRTGHVSAAPTGDADPGAVQRGGSPEAHLHRCGRGGADPRQQPVRGAVDSSQGAADGGGRCLRLYADYGIVYDRGDLLYLQCEIR